MDQREYTKKLTEHFGSREVFLGKMLLDLSLSGQPCDVTFYKCKPILDVRVPQKISLALLYGAGPEKLHEMLSSIKFSDGTIASIGEIWTVNPMPSGGISEEDLESVDLSQGDKEMIRQSYHCQSKQEEDRYLRRYLAS
jgi:hypothetical protein